MMTAMPARANSVILAALAIVSPMAAQPAPIATHLCEVTQHPADFNGKLIQIRAVVLHNFEISLLSDESCAASVWFTGPSTTFISMGMPKTEGNPVKLVEDDKYRSMQKYLAAQYKPKNKKIYCIGCSLYKVTVTVIGRFDHVREQDGGFGHLNAYDSELVLQQVLEVSPEALDTAGYEK